MRLRYKILIVGAIALLAGIAGLFIYRIVFLRMVRVPTPAMANTIVPGDQLVVKKLMGAVSRGDIILFRYPSDPSVQYVARVVGLPGETILARDSQVFINGNPIPETRVLVKADYDYDVGVLEEISSQGSGPYRVFYYKREATSPTPEVFEYGVKEPFHIPADQYFVMGDNRDNSLDSRHYGTVPRSLIWGRPTTIYFSSHADQSHQETVKWDRIGKTIK